MHNKRVRLNLYSFNNIFFTNKSILCTLDNCPPLIASKYDMYLVSGSAARMLGESIDEFALNMDWIEFGQCYRLLHEGDDSHCLNGQSISPSYNSSMNIINSIIR